MQQRVADIGVPAAEEDGVLSFVTDFDLQALSPADQECLSQNTHRCATGRQPLKGAQVSVNTKHNAAYLDMLRHGITHALILEDDATFVSGSKTISQRGATPTRVTFDVTRSYGTRGFNESFERVLVPELPNLATHPEGFVKTGLGVDFLRTTSRAAAAAAPLFDVLQLGACDNPWQDWYKGGNPGLLKGGPHRYAAMRFSSHLSKAHECSRCAIGYVISASGATRMLSVRSLPYIHSIDHQLNGVSAYKRSEGREMNCLWAEPPLIWEDAGAEGDGLTDATNKFGYTETAMCEVKPGRKKKTHEWSTGH